MPIARMSALVAQSLWRCASSTAWAAAGGSCCQVGHVAISADSLMGWVAWRSCPWLLHRWGPTAVACVLCRRQETPRKIKMSSYLSCLRHMLSLKGFPLLAAGCLWRCILRTRTDASASGAPRQMLVAMHHQAHGDHDDHDGHSRKAPGVSVLHCS